MEIEKVVNERPIAVAISDPNEPRALSPSDLLYGQGKYQGLPETEEIIKTAETATAFIFSRRFKQQQAILQTFWSRFQNEYLQQLRSAHYRKPQNSRPIREGDVSLIHSREASRAY